MQDPAPKETPGFEALVETAWSESLKVDRDAGVIRGVKILGRESKNDREYAPAAMAEAARLYEGLAVNLNHPDRARPAAERPVQDGIGWLESVEVRPDGVYGDLHFLKSHPHSAVIVEAAERNPKRFGLSHNACGRVIRNGKRCVVESIERVLSVDIVQNPATSSGLFESENGMPTRTAGEIRKAPEQLTPLPEPASSEPAGDSEGGDSADASESKAGTIDARLAQLAGRLDRFETEAACRDLLESKNRACDGTRLKALAALATEAERLALVESWPERSKAESFTALTAGSSQRPNHSPPASDVLKFPADTKTFVAAIK